MGRGGEFLAPIAGASLRALLSGQRGPRQVVEEQTIDEVKSVASRCSCVSGATANSSAAAVTSGVQNVRPLVQLVPTECAVLIEKRRDHGEAFARQDVLRLIAIRTARDLGASVRALSECGAPFIVEDDEACRNRQALPERGLQVSRNDGRARSRSGLSQDLGALQNESYSSTHSRLTSIGRS
jgi:hypothetical protein